MLRDALHAPARADDAVGTLIVGGSLLFLSALSVPLWLVLAVEIPPAVVLAPLALAPLFVLRGYYVRVVAAGIEEESGIPSIVRWGRLYRDGVKSLLLSIGYLLPLAALVALAAQATVLIRADRVGLGEPGEAVLAISIAFLAVISVGYLVAFAYLRPAGLAVLADSGRLRDAFKPRRVGRIAANAEFATGWLLAMFVVLAGLALTVPFVVMLVGFPLVFLVRVVVHSLYGRGAAAALRPEETAVETTLTTVGFGAEIGREDDSAAAPEPEPIPPDPAVADPDVQTGRSVPLTATDVLSRAATAEAGRSEPIEDSDSDQPAGNSDSDGPTGNSDSGEPGFEWADTGNPETGDNGRAGSGEPSR